MPGPDSNVMLSGMRTVIFPGETATCVGDASADCHAQIPAMQKRNDRIRNLRCWTCAVLAAVALPVLAQGKSAASSDKTPIPLNPQSSVYKATLDHGISFNGQATRRITQRKDGLWEFHFDVTSFIADIHESVIFRWNGRQVVPLHYRYSLSGWAVPDRDAKLDFDWDKQRVRNDVRNKPWNMPIHAGVLDRLGFQLQLRQDLKAGKDHMTYDIADGGKLKDFEFAVVKKGPLKTKHGTIETIQVDQIRDPHNHKRETHLWFAPKWDYLLVRMIQIENGTKYEIYLDSAQLPNKTINPIDTAPKTTNERRLQGP